MRCGCLVCCERLGIWSAGQMWRCMRMREQRLQFRKDRVLPARSFRQRFEYLNSARFGGTCQALLYIYHKRSNIEICPVTVEAANISIE